MEEKFDSWNEIKKEINKKDMSNIYFKEWDIWWTFLWQNIWTESFWKWENFRRPVLIFRKLSSDNFLAIPLSTKIKKWTWFCEFNLQWEIRTALLYQIKMMNKKRLGIKLWQLDELDFKEIKNKLRNLLNL